MIAYTVTAIFHNESISASIDYFQNPIDQFLSQAVSLPKQIPENLSVTVQRKCADTDRQTTKAKAKPSWRLCRDNWQ